jgi:hypothetical protein
VRVKSGGSEARKMAMNCMRKGMYLRGKEK